MCGWFGSGGGIAMGLMMLFWLLLMVGFIVMIIAVVRQVIQPHGTATESAVDILKKRYARGEISKEEFDRMRQDLS